MFVVFELLSRLDILRFSPLEVTEFAIKTSLMLSNTATTTIIVGLSSCECFKQSKPTCSKETNHLYTSFLQIYIHPPHQKDQCQLPLLLYMETLSSPSCASLGL